MEATHLPFVQVLIGFTRPERGNIQRDLCILGASAFAEALFLSPQAEFPLKYRAEFVNKVEIMRDLPNSPLESRGDFLYNATIRAYPEEAETQ